MELIGTPVTIQNTPRAWLVSWPDAVRHGPESEPDLENVSFTVAIPRNAKLTIEEVQTYALKRAVELLQLKLKHMTQG